MNGFDVFFMLLIVAQAWLITLAITPHEKIATFPRLFFCFIPGALNTCMLMWFYSEKLNWWRWMQ